MADDRAELEGFEFGIERPARVRADSTIELIGRVCRGTLEVGATFRLLRGIQKKVDSPYEVVWETEIRLSIHSLQAYGHSLTTIDEGMTCRLTVVGESPTLGANMVLVGGAFALVPGHPPA